MTPDIPLNGIEHQILFRQGLVVNINALPTCETADTGEPHYATDTGHLYIFDGNQNQRVHGLDMAVVHDGDVVTFDGEIVWF